MPEIGQSVSHYRIIEKLGQGGMGEVFLAQDTSLDRKVALKFLQDIFSGDPERLARFEREAKLSASLNHPNIAALFGFEQADGKRYLVMELVEGETLAERIAKGPLPVEEALEVCRQIAEGLEAAHEKGIIHRDLKPANVKITSEGKAKILDFGLAKAMTGEADGIDATQSPTITEAMTRPGVILGTTAYMSPEQARGATVDKRADIWAFGVVLFEMLAGHTCFTGDTITDLLAAVVRAEPDWSKLPSGTPPRVRELLRRCLSKDRKRRLHDIGDARLELEEALDHGASITIETEGSSALVSRPETSWRERSAWVLLVISVVVVAIFTHRWTVREPAATEWNGSLLPAPDGARGPRLSPSGSLLAFTVPVDGLSQVAVMNPEIGASTVLTRDRARGGAYDLSWKADNSLIYFDRYVDVANGVFSVPAVGGTEQLVWENACCAEALPDGSLLGIRLNAGKYQLFQFWPSTGQTRAFPAAVKDMESDRLRAFPNGREAAMIGVRIGVDTPSREQLLVIDLDTGGVRELMTGLPEAEQSLFSPAVSPDGASVLVVNREGQFQRVLKIAKDGSRPARTILGLTQRVLGLDMTANGTMYLEQYMVPSEWLRLWPEQHRAERFARFQSARPELTSLPEDRCVLPLPSGTGFPLMMVNRRGERVPLVDASERATAPTTLAGAGQIACVAGPPAQRSIALISIENHRITNRIPFDKGIIRSLASSPDGRILYAAANDRVWMIPTSGGEPVEMRKGRYVAVDPEGKYLMVLAAGDDRSHLYRVSLSGGQEQEILLDGPWRLDLERGISPQAIRNGQMLVPLSSADSDLASAGIIDLATGHVTRWNFDYPGGFETLAWTSDGQVVALSTVVESALWKFQQEPNKK